MMMCLWVRFLLLRNAIEIFIDASSHERDGTELVPGVVFARHQHHDRDRPLNDDDRCSLFFLHFFLNILHVSERRQQ
jgi:hypothetical protein